MSINEKGNGDSSVGAGLSYQSDDRTFSVEQATVETFSSRIAKLPSFWKEEPDIWFTQVEAAFSLAQITRDETKYQYLVTNLDSTILPFVTDIIRNPPSSCKYEQIKKRILSTFSNADETRLRRVLKGQLLGDQKPSHFLQHLPNLSANQCKDAVLRLLFLEQLPVQVKGILVASLEQDLEKLAQLADRIVELQQPPQVFSTSVTSSSANTSTSSSPGKFSMADLQLQIVSLTSRFDQLNRNFNHQ